MPTSSPDASPLAAEPLPPTAPALLDADGRIATDVPCLCGYNLRTLARNGLCPECAAPVAQALERHGDEVVQWLSGVCESLIDMRQVVIFHVVFLVFAGASYLKIRGLEMAGMVFLTLSAIPAILGTMMSPLFLWLVTAPPPKAWLGVFRFRARRLARVLLSIAVLGALAGFTCGAFAESGIGGAEHVATVCGVLAWAAAALLPAAIAFHVADVAWLFAASKTVRLSRAIGCCLVIVHPATLLYFFLGAAHVLLLVSAFATGTCLSLLGLHAAIRALRPYVRNPIPRGWAW